MTRVVNVKNSRVQRWRLGMRGTEVTVIRAGIHTARCVYNSEKFIMKKKESMSLLFSQMR